MGPRGGIQLETDWFVAITSRLSSASCGVTVSLSYINHTDIAMVLKDG